MQKIFFQKIWQRLLFLAFFALANLILFLTIAVLMQKPQVRVLPTEIVFIAPAFSDTPVPSDIALPVLSFTPSPSLSSTPTISPSPSATASESPSPTISASATMTSIPSATLAPAVVLLTQPETQNASGAASVQVIPMVIVNPNEAIPTYATVPAGLEEFAQAAFRYVYGLRPIRSLSANQNEVHIGFVLDMSNYEWDTGSGLVSLACNLWRNGFANQTYLFVAYQETVLGSDLSYHEKVRVRLSASDVPQMPCAAPETLDLPNFADFYWGDF